MAILITGVAGFIGVNLVRVLLEQGGVIFGVDNLSRGTHDNIREFNAHARFKFAQIDIAKIDAYLEQVRQFERIEKITEVWHLAANSDIPAGVNDPVVDLKDTFMTTFNTLDVMRNLNIKRLIFSSSSAVYGDHGEKPLVEDMGPLLPISNYGAMKLASEAVISAGVESFVDQACILRFPNVIGVPATHGVMLDFVRKLKDTPDELQVLGNGRQQKGYLHVEELINAMIFIRNHAKEKLSVFNIGANDDGVTVRFIAEETVRLASPDARITYGQGDKGWVGDVPRFVYSVEKLKKLGWAPRQSSTEAVQKAIAEIIAQEASI